MYQCDDQLRLDLALLQRFAGDASPYHILLFLLLQTLYVVAMEFQFL
ncbi:hypothetical protein XNC3_920043 [Xenorhabdus nematophila F1]|nr:hypothetical protein XNC3_920043 [Xenorhabdus nematophila F1]